MRSMSSAPESNAPDEAAQMNSSPHDLWQEVRCPGLTPSAAEVLRLVREIPRKMAASRYKGEGNVVWVVFVGGTGTGKSTLFNALCGKNLSEAGVERPKTYGPIGYVHRNVALEKGFPFRSMEISRSSGDDGIGHGAVGATGRLVLREHQHDALAHLVLVDTPDLDSLELSNRRMVEDLYLLSHSVVFVTSPEKYADDVPFQFLRKMDKEGKPYFLLLNKSREASLVGEVQTALKEQGLTLPQDRFFAFPYLPSHTSVMLPEDENFLRFQKTFFGMLSPATLPRFLESERKKDREKGVKELRLLIHHLEKEKAAAAEWLNRLDISFYAACRFLQEKQKEGLNEQTRAYLKRQIRDTFGRYDLLRAPRRFIAEIVRTPLRWLGMIGSGAPESREETFARIRSHMDLVPIHAALESFHRSVLSDLSPSERSSALFESLRAQGTALSHEEVQQAVKEEQDGLIRWLEEKFQELAAGIPRSQELGIYSTSILWGGLILAFETAIGGGISILEAVLDSAIAPFVTQGAVELFAYRELRKIALELGKRYQDGLVSVVRRQRDRYARCMASLLTTDETIQHLKSYGEKVCGERP
ncbi:hypothetical protein DSTSK_15080 [Desulforhabdus sp. TSK]|nr:hypothetical protein DSTSK_15080 [Desulforhabdus sp. TSK]